MKYDEMVHKVQQQAGLRDREQAQLVLDATLETLGERITDGERDDLAAQLPEELAAPLRRHRATGTFGLDEFCRRLEERAGVDQPQECARTVISLVEEAVTPGEMDDVRSQLPADFAPLFAGADR